MQREIKFRVWDKDEKTMDYDVVIAGNRMIFDYELKKSGDIEANCYVDIEEYNKKYFEIMQYTGLHDVLNEAIYEGDILEDQEGNLYKIEFEICKFVANRLDGKGGTFISPQMRWWKIKGNIYENPDLLERRI